MIRAVDLGVNSEIAVNLETLRTLNIHNFWLELIDPTPEEMQAVAEKTAIPRHFLDFPKTEGTVNLRLEEEFTIINFVIPRDIVVTKEVDPLVIAFSKTFLVTVKKKPDQHIFETVKERMSKVKIDPPALVTYFIIDEIVSTHFVYLQKLETLTSRIEEEVVEKINPETLKKIFKLKSKLS